MEVTDPYRDAIGTRLDHPEKVPAQCQHLIADDIQRVERILSFPVSGRVLDIGCSDGAITRRIAEKWPGLMVEAADLLPQTYIWSGIMRWRWDVTSDAPPVWIRDPFDAVYCCEVLEHLTDADAEQALRNMLAVLKPGGDLIVTVPNRYPADLYEVGCRSRWAWPSHLSAWGSGKLTKTLEPYFGSVELVPLYDGELPTESIWIIARGRGKR